MSRKEFNSRMLSEDDIRRGLYGLLALILVCGGGFALNELAKLVNW